jgi:hypothetical protein
MEVLEKGLRWSKYSQQFAESNFQNCEEIQRNEKCFSNLHLALLRSFHARA